MSSLKFAANISTMFHEVNILNRFKEAKRKGFEAIEAQDLYSCDIDDLRQANENPKVKIVLINSVAQWRNGNSGMACNIGAEEDFLKGLNISKNYAISLNCPKIHILAGIPTEEEKNQILRLEETYLKNLKLAASVLSEHNIMALIEPICKEVKDGYFLNNFDKAVEYIQNIGMDNLKLQMDIFHMKMLGLDPKVAIKQYLPYTGHIQISQAPSRHEPNFEGDINYSEIFEILKNSKYSDFIGLEYKPSGTTDESLSWMNEL